MSVSVDHPTDRPNFTIVSTPAYRVAFSYRTIVGLNRYDGNGWLVSRNEWGPTTGKHLNWLDDGDKGSRVDHDALMAIVAEVTS
jgi:hypothetical protein